MNRINKDSIENLLKEAKDGLHIKDISRHLVNRYSGLFPEDKLDYDKVYKRVGGILNREVKKIDSVFTRVKSQKTKKDKQGYYKLKQKKKDPTPDPISNPKTKTNPNPVPIDKNKNLFTGKAGECAVMSELLFRGYNVNSMLVDDGIDIVASKNNMFYYIQVKTTYLDDKNKISVTIKEKRFNDYFGTQIRYVAAARCKLKGIETNLYFVFDNSRIKQLIYDKIIHENNGNIYVKIEIDQKDGKPYIYHDNKKTDVSYHLNNFDL